MSLSRFITLLVFAAIMLSLAAADAAVIRLRADHRATGGIVRLGDVAVVESADADEARRLKAIELFPAPAAGRTHQFMARDVEDALIRRNENPIDHQFSGASQVTVSGVAATTGRPTAFLTTSQTRHATERVQKAIAEYLATHAAAGHWQVELTLTAQQADTVRTNPGLLTVSGGQELPDGTVRFDIVLDTLTGPAQFTVDATVSFAEAVVVAVRPLQRGSTVNAADVELRHAEPVRGEKGTFTTIEEVIGMRVVRSIRLGQVLDDRAVQPVLLVRRREIVTVYSRAGGVEVRTTARAVEDGSHGELIAVESLADRKSYFARVSGPQQVEVTAQPVRPAPLSPRFDDSRFVQQQGTDR